MSVQSSARYNGSVHIEMLSPHGYLSAAIWPLYFNVNAYMFAEWVSIAKRALARMLVIIVSLGFGIVKPRLGPALQRVVGTGVLWGVLAAINAWLRLHHKDSENNRDLLLSEVPLSLVDSAISWWNNNRDLLLSEVPLSLVDSAISWWVFVSLAHTMRTLQLRRITTATCCSPRCRSPWSTAPSRGAALPGRQRHLVVGVRLARAHYEDLATAQNNNRDLLLSEVPLSLVDSAISWWNNNRDLLLSEVPLSLVDSAISWWNNNRDLLLSEVPLSLVDSAISWWVFVSLAHTMRTLQLRRTYRVTACITDWKEVWMDEAYWHIQFAGILCVIMVLWRPTNNNQRYAFTPLLDNAEDDDEVWMDEAYWHIQFAGILCVIMVLWRPTNNNQRYAFTPLLDNAEDDDEVWMDEAYWHIQFAGILCVIMVL
ncbi:Transmembrane protein 87A [Operophtera brumata]|uniref:Transmembrane protein 87A n=1 Tax=Operophtera brumata TaxID=104452 RepID=A0A0L7LTT9_OPEBR|nr:Transmembrane protein 87A [Operophtera brumata]